MVSMRNKKTYPSIIIKYPLLSSVLYKRFASQQCECIQFHLFSSFYKWVQLSCIPICFSSQQKPFQNGAVLQGKNLHQVKEVVPSPPVKEADCPCPPPSPQTILIYISTNAKCSKKEPLQIV